MVRVLATGDHTRGVAAVIEYEIAPHGRAPGLHWHRAFDGFFYVVSGELTAVAAGRTSTFRSRDFLFVPRGVVHNFTNESDETCVFLSGWTPSGSEKIWTDGAGLPKEVYDDPTRLQEAINALIDTVAVTE